MSASFERVGRLGIVNCFLVSEEDGLTLIDTMIGGSASKIIAAADGFEASIRRIVLTHAHTDHVGSLDALAERLPEAEVLISSREARLLAGEMSPQPGEPDDKPKGSFPKVSTEPTRTVEPGERIGSLEVIAAPGHTPGHVALLDRRDRTLFCGDAFTTIGGVAVPSKPKLAFPFPYFATWHGPTTVRTAAALTELAPTRLAPGHGKVTEEPAQAMARAVASAS
jgi:glyoxylase-like metal-dependent hydrolase (beta-lactamase superfamily II)